MGVWLILSFFLGFLPSMFTGALIGLAISVENEWVGRLGLVSGVIGGAVMVGVMAVLDVAPEGFAGVG